MKKFINPDWKALRKLAPSLKLAWFYLWDKADSIGVYDHDDAYFQIDNGCEVEFEELLKLPGVQKISETKILLVDYIIVNYGQLKDGYNPHKPAFRDLDKNNLKLNSSLNQACPKLEDEEEDEDEDKEEDKDKDEKEITREVEKKSEPKSLIPENFPFKSPEAIKAMEDYIKHRRQLKVRPYTQIGIETAMKTWESWGEAMFIEAVYESIRKNYQGIFPPNSNNNGATNKNYSGYGKPQGRVEPKPGASCGDWDS